MGKWGGRASSNKFFELRVCVRVGRTKFAELGGRSFGRSFREGKPRMCVCVEEGSKKSHGVLREEPRMLLQELKAAKSEVARAPTFVFSSSCLWKDMGAPLACALPPSSRVCVGAPGFLTWDSICKLCLPQAPATRTPSAVAVVSNFRAFP